MTRSRSIVTAAVVAACISTACALGACATDGAAPATSPPEEPAHIPAADSGLDAAPEDAGDEAGPCIEHCEYFPETCTADVLCSNGPFDPGTIGGPFDPRTQINVVSGRSASDVWVAGALGSVAHFDGTSWARSETDRDEPLRALWLRDSEELALARLEFIFARGLADIDASVSDDGWTLRPTTSFAPEYTQTPKTFVSAWGAPGSERLWATTRSGWESFGVWRLRANPGGTFAVEMAIPPEACHQFSCRSLNSVHGSSADEVWAVGVLGVAMRITDAESDSPKVKLFNTQTWNALYGVWSSGAEAWAVGASGTIRHYRGDPLYWDVVEGVPTDKNLNAVWGASASDVWAVGDAGVVLHWDGTRWSRMKIAGLGRRRPKLTTVWMPAPGHVWIGGQGVVLSLGGMP